MPKDYVSFPCRYLLHRICRSLALFVIRYLSAIWSLAEKADGAEWFGSV